MLVANLQGLSMKKNFYFKCNTTKSTHLVGQRFDDLHPSNSLGTKQEYATSLYHFYDLHY